jgi:hypothetical protein
MPAIRTQAPATTARLEQRPTAADGKSGNRSPLLLHMVREFRTER